MSGLAPQEERSCREEGMTTWPSCDSLFNVTAGTSGSLSNTSSGANTCISSPTYGPARQLRRKKALAQLCLASPSSMGSPVGPASTLQFPKYDEAHGTVDDNSHVASSSGVRTNTFNLPTLLTLSGEQVKIINNNIYMSTLICSWPLNFNLKV